MMVKKKQVTISMPKSQKYVDLALLTEYHNDLETILQ